MSEGLKDCLHPYPLLTKTHTHPPSPGVTKENRDLEGRSLTAVWGLRVATGVSDADTSGTRVRGSGVQPFAQEPHGQKFT